MEGFIPFTIGNTEQTAFRYLPVTDNATYYVGQAMYFSSGKLTAATGSTNPEYICMEGKAVESGADETICVTPVREDIIYETHSSVAMVDGSSALLKPGTKVTIASSGTFDSVSVPAGMRVTATTVDGSSNPCGVAEIVDIRPNVPAGKAASAINAVVHVRFSV